MGREQRANAARREAIEAISKAITGRAADRGHIIEAGFAAMIQATYPKWEEMPLDQLKEIRMAFFGGAQHLWGSIMNMLDPGEEPSARDMRRMDLIAHELDAFITEFKQEHGITDPDIGPAEGTRQ